MGIIYVKDALYGNNHAVRIAGDTPSETEQARIDKFLASKAPQPAPASEPIPEESSGGGFISGLGDFANSTRYGLAKSLSEIPGGAAAIGEVVTGNDIGSTSLGDIARNISDTTGQAIDDFTGPIPDNVWAKSGQTLGSLASFLIPATGVAKALSLAGKGAKAIQVGAGATASLQGAALGSSEQLARLEDKMAEGEIIPDDVQKAAVLWGSAIGLSEGLPVGKLAGPIAKILNEVPREGRKDAIGVIKKRLLNAGGNALAEGGQEVMAGVAQDLVEKNLFNPEAVVGKDAWDNAVYGGGAGAGMSLVLDWARGRAIRPREQLEEDLEEEGQRAAQQLEASKAAQEQSPQDPITQKVDDFQGWQDSQSEQRLAAAEAINETQAYENWAGQEIDPVRVAAEERVKAEVEKRSAIVSDPVDVQSRPEYVPPTRKVNVTAPRAAELQSRLPSLFEGKVETNGKRNTVYIANPKAVADEIEKVYGNKEDKTIRPQIRSSMLRLADDVRKIKPRPLPKPKIKQADRTNSSVEPTKAQNAPLRLGPQDGPVSTPSTVVQEPSRPAVRGATEPSVTQMDPTQVMAPDGPVRPVSSGVEVSDYQERKKRKDDAVKALNNGLVHMNFPDIDLKAEDLIEPSSTDLVEGSERAGGDGRRVMSVAMNIYDPDISQDEYMNRLQGVMSHELIHSMRALGIITEKEWQTLSVAASKRQYVADKNGKSVARDYTYLDREVARYKARAGSQNDPRSPEEINDAIAEEAVAEMYRHYAEGKLKVGGPVGGIFKKIMRFLKGIGKSGKSSGFESSEEFFRAVDEGEVGARERGQNPVGLRGTTAKDVKFASVPTGKAYDEWAGTSDPVIEADEINDIDFSIPRDAWVMKAFHGTTHEFNKFDAGINENKRGYFGAVNYFTSSLYDAETNYGRSGPDNRIKVENLSENLIEMDDLADRFEQATGEAYENASEDQISDFVGVEAEREALGDTDKTLRVLVRTEKPFVIGAADSPWVEFTDYADLQMQAEEDVAADLGVSVEEMRKNDDHYDGVMERTYELEADADNPLINAIESAALEYNFNAGDVIADINEMIWEGTYQRHLEQALRKSETLSQTEDQTTGELVSGHVIGQIIKKLGYDSIIMKNADEKFRNMGMTPGTAHIHVFDEFNTNIKSQDNEGSFSREDPDIMRSAVPTSSPPPGVAAEMNEKIDRGHERVMYTTIMDKLSKALGTVMPENKAAERSQWFITQLQDRMVPIGSIIDDLRSKGLHVSDAMDTYRQEELYHGVVGGRIERNTELLYDPAVEAVDKISISDRKAESLKNSSEFFRLADDDYRSRSLAVIDTYLYARHAKQRNDYIKGLKNGVDDGSGMSDIEADAIIDWYNNLPQRDRSQIDMAESKVRSVISNTNAIRLDAGLSTAEMVASDGVGENYIPLKGMLLETDAEAINESIHESAARLKGTALFGASGREDMRTLGRGKYARDLMANAMQQNGMTVMRAERNRVGQSFLELIRGSGGELDGVARILETEDGTKTKPHKRSRRGNTIVRSPVDYRGSPDKYIVVKENGEETIVEVADARIAQAMNGSMNPKTMGTVVRTMGKINRWLSSVNTSYNPEFLLSNFPRDLGTAVYNLGQYDIDNIRRELINDIPGAITGISQYIFKKDKSSPWAKVYDDFIQSGGRNSLNTMDDLATRIEGIQSKLTSLSDDTAKGKLAPVKNASKVAMDKVKAVGSYLEGANTVFENATRVAVFKALTDRGVSKDRAAQVARNLTTNFAKGGELKPYLNSLYLFFNASLQGSMSLMNATARNPKKMGKILAGITAMGFMLDQLNALMSDEDDDGKLVYDKIGDYTLEHNLILPDFLGISDRNHFRIPLPYGLHMIQNNGRVASRYLRGTYENKDVLNSLYGSVMETFNPFGDSWNPITGEGDLRTMISPTIGDPFFQTAGNFDYADRPIYKEQSQFGVSAPQSSLYWGSTDTAYVQFAKALNEVTGGNTSRAGWGDLSPDLLEFWVEFVTGATGQTIVRTASLPFVTYDALQDGIQDDMMNNIPLVRKLTVSVSDRQDTGAFAEKRDEVLKVEKELKDAIKAKDKDWVQEVRSEFAAELRILPQVKALNSLRNKLRKQRNLIDVRTDIPKEQKKILLDRIDEKIKQVVNKANQIMSQI